MTLILILIGEVFIYLPSIARYRQTYFEMRIISAHLAAFAPVAAGGKPLSAALEQQILNHTQVKAVLLHQNTVELVLGEIPPVDAVFALDREGPSTQIMEAINVLLQGGDRTIRAYGRSPKNQNVVVDIVLDEDSLYRDMLGYSWRILLLSLVLSALVGTAMFLILRLMIVRPLAEITQSVIAFRQRPEDVRSTIPPSPRTDEIGVVQNELGGMQERVRQALDEQGRLAALGAAVGKINHDLRNVLASATLLSDRLAQVDDPTVKQVAPRLVEALDRANRLCAETLAYAKRKPPTLSLQPILLKPFLDQMADDWLQDRAQVEWRNEMPAEASVSGDRDQLYRLFGNLMKNSLEAMGDEGGVVSVTGAVDGDQVVIELADTGPGVPISIRDKLFQAFESSGRPNGTGLGLANAREIAQRHGGSLFLSDTGESGTVFRLELPK